MCFLYYKQIDFAVGGIVIILILQIPSLQLFSGVRSQKIMLMKNTVNHHANFFAFFSSLYHLVCFLVCLKSKMSLFDADNSSYETSALRTQRKYLSPDRVFILRSIEKLFWPPLYSRGDISCMGFVSKMQKRHQVWSEHPNNFITTISKSSSITLKYSWCRKRTVWKRFILECWYFILRFY